MIGVNNMFVKYTFGSPLQEYIYKLEDTVTNDDIINLGRYLVTCAGIIDRDSFIYEQVDSLDSVIEKVPAIKPINIGLTNKEIESMLEKVI